MMGEEQLAVVLALGYVLLAIRQRRLAWLLAAASAGLYLHIFLQVDLYMEAGLQVFYIVAAAYGWWVWQQDGSTERLPVQSWPIRRHMTLLAAVLVVGAALGLALDQYTGAALPIPDSISTLAALLATWMVTRKVLENWLWWIGIDLLSMAIYIDRGLLLTAGLFAGYVVLAAAGWLQWRRDFKAQHSQDN